MQFKVEALELNLDLANKDNLALTDNLSKLTADFAKYRSTTVSIHAVLIKHALPSDKNPMIDPSAAEFLSLSIPHICTRAWALLAIPIFYPTT